MIAQSLKYILLVQDSKLQILILLVLIKYERPIKLQMAETITEASLSLPVAKDNNTIQDNHRERCHKACAVLFVTQALCINTMGIISLLSGVPLLLVVLLITVQGAYLIIDVHRAEPR